MVPGEFDTAVLEDVDPEELVRTINTVMPFGRFKGRKLLELPEPYLVWFHTEGFPRSKLGEQLGLMYEIKVNGLETILRPLMRNDEGD